MPRKLTTEQIAAYERDGYVCPVDAFAPERCRPGKGLQKEAGQTECDNDGQRDSQRFELVHDRRRAGMHDHPSQENNANDSKEQISFAHMPAAASCATGVRIRLECCHR